MYREKFENYLRNTGRDELNPEKIKANLEMLYSNPKAGREAVKERIRHNDRDTIASIISQRIVMNQVTTSTGILNIFKILRGRIKIFKYFDSTYLNYKRI